MQGSLKRLWSDLFDETDPDEEGLSGRQAKLSRTEPNKTTKLSEDTFKAQHHRIHPANTQPSTLAAAVPGLHLIKGFLDDAQQVRHADYKTCVNNRH
jgi:hypothetical protein